MNSKPYRVPLHPVDVDQLHIDDWVWMGDRRMLVRGINRDDSRVLVGGRKHSCGNCEVRWVESSELRTRPKALRRKNIKTVHELPAEIAEAIDWTPTRKPYATIAPPGSELKIEILRMRVERGEHLFHANDCGNRKDPG